MSETPTPSSGAAGHSPTVRRAVALRLNGGQTVDGIAHMPGTQSLAPFLSLRRGGLLTISSPEGFGGVEAEAGHLMLRMASVLYAWPSDHKLEVDHRMPGPNRRRIRLTFNDRSELEGVIAFQAGIRVSDYLARVEDFVPLRGVLVPDMLGGAVDVAFNIESVNTVLDLGKVPAAGASDVLGSPVDAEPSAPYPPVPVRRGTTMLTVFSRKKP